ncbi:glycerophosphodiester phosphodiesterase [Vagococcus sp. BWB3-3]|uniref:Glycerophosphodiester phosphodiesterase n=1 Tax=Vagococcus allomyrinae TaxID=2794353 RepID=A0A940P673_9ENTE|nr:glycerophosphodiester phosphodiesterase [Vagococcus allomyrinae]MBP1041780.1 glycerophosphodiester phosphodiesterase [Vagococcus allomyrinae]
MTILKNVQYSFQRVLETWPDYFKSLLILQFIRVAIVLPLLSFLFYKMLSRAKIAGVTNENFSAIFSHPLALLIGLALLLLFVFFIFYELGFYILLAHNQATGQSIAFWDIAKGLNRKVRFFLSLNSLLLVGYFILIMPIVSIGLNAELTSMIKIPDFIVDELSMTTSGLIMYIGVIIVLSYIALHLLYVVYFFVTDKEATIWQAIRKSWYFSKGRSISNLVILGLLVGGYGLLLGGITFVLFLPLVFADAYLPLIAPVVAGITITVVEIFLFLFGGVIQPLVANGIVGTTREGQPFLKDIPKFKFQPKLWAQTYPKWRNVLIIGLVVFIGFNIWSAISVVYAPQTEIVAHRGFTEKGVENTIGSLKAAAEVHADVVEMDIQETRDGKFVVMHDYNLKRLAGVNEEVRNLNLAELEQLTVKQSGFQDRIPSLSDYIDVAKKERIKLLIEVKPHGHESNEMAQNLVNLLKEKNVITDFYVQSLDIKILNEIKEIEPAIQTAYVIPLNLGSLPETMHDFYVLEEFSVTESLLTQAAAMNKEVFVWTVNKEDLLRKYLRLDVDGIITNHPDLAIKLRDSQEETRTFLNRVQYLLED